MNGDHTQLVEIAQGVARLKTAIASALVGGTDPCHQPEALLDLELLEKSCPSPDDQKLKAFIEGIRNPDAYPGINRKVLLARGQRYLLTLTMWLEDHAPTAPDTKKTKSSSKSANTQTLSTPYDAALLSLAGVGPKTAARLASRGLSTIKEVLFWLPRRYDDRRTVTPLADIRAGARVVTQGTIKQVRVYGRPWKRIMELIVEDGDATLSGMWFSNRRPTTEKFVAGETVILAGLVGKYKDRLQIAHPIVVHENDESDRIGRIVPVYPEVPDVPGRTVEKAVGDALCKIDQYIDDPIPEALVANRGLIPLTQALKLVHLPPADAEFHELDAWVNGSSPAHQRLAYDEFLYIQLALGLRKKQEHQVPAPAISTSDNLAKEAGNLLGFSPTDAQTRVIGEIQTDLNRPYPMRRLLQGDVGSGKTMVALAAILACTQEGYQAALMAPTEILAEQHMRTLEPVLRQLGIKSALHMGNARSSARKKFTKGIEAGTIQVAIGTHALIQESVQFSNLGLAIVDEQHRFGVAQRLGLVGKGPKGSSPHLLVMTATPIPRTLALTVHGDLDISVLDELPPGRTPIETTFLPSDLKEQALIQLDRVLERGEQAYVVCPLIEESEKLDVSAAENVFETLCVRYGAERTGLLHGRLGNEERDQVMDDFLNKEIAVLVSTTVIEVGVNIPNATMMIIEGAERFGLAQLHQLRGRVGRGVLPSTCFLIGDPKSEDGLSRMEVLVNTNDGFRIAEEDLTIRGPGELYGKRQAGLPGFRFGNLARDLHLLEYAREDAQTLLSRSSNLNTPSTRAIKAELTRRILSGEGPIGEESG